MVIGINAAAILDCAACEFKRGHSSQLLKLRLFAVAVVHSEGASSGYAAIADASGFGIDKFVPELKPSRRL